jgi:hypothetical protein
MYETAPHGAICAVLLPHVFRKNAENLQKMVDTEGATAVTKQRLERFREVARIVTGIEGATVLQVRYVVQLKGVPLMTIASFSILILPLALTLTLYQHLN